MPAKKQTTKEMILSASFKILKEQGFEAINIKLIAKHLNCSTQPIYLSFSKMDELRNELIPLAVNEFVNYMKNSNSSKAIHLYDLSYIKFAKDEPKLFCFLFMRENSFLQIKNAIYPIIDASILELMSSYNISHDKADMLHDQLWMHAHGIASMLATSFCSYDMDKVEGMLLAAKQAFTKDLA